MIRQPRRSIAELERLRYLRLMRAAGTRHLFHCCDDFRAALRPQFDRDEFPPRA